MSSNLFAVGGSCLDDDGCWVVLLKAAGVAAAISYNKTTMKFASLNGSSFHKMISL